MSNSIVSCIFLDNCRRAVKTYLSELEHREIE